MQVAPASRRVDSDPAAAPTILPLPRLVVPCQPKGIYAVDRVAADIRIQIAIAALESDWIFTDELASRRQVVSGSVVVEACLGVPFSACERITTDARANLEIA